MAKSARTKLAPGQHSIDRVTPRQVDGKWLIDWTVCLHDGQVIAKRSQGKTKGQARSRARAKAEELLAIGTPGSWKFSSKITDYIDQVSIPTVQSARLRENSKARYVLALGQVKAVMGKHTLGSGTKFRALESAIQAIAAEHGRESGRQARTVLSKYVIQQLIRDGILNHNPLYGMSIDLGEVKRSTKPAGGRALSVDEWNRVLDYLLSIDPSEGVEKPKRGPYTLENRVAVRRNVIDLTILQATTGLRIAEARAAKWEDVTISADGTMTITVTEETSKTHRARVIPVLDSRAAARLRARREAIDGRYVIGAPTDPTRVWDRDNAQKQVKKLHEELADVLGIELLRTARSHVWRTTLNSALMGAVPEVVRAAYFGHDTTVNRTAYTDTADTSQMVSAATALRKPTV